MNLRHLSMLNLLNLKVLIPKREKTQGTLDTLEEATKMMISLKLMNL